MEKKDRREVKRMNTKATPNYNQPGEAAKAICDELRKNRYVLSYAPAYFSYADARRLLIIAHSGINVRSKTHQPPR